MIEGNDGGATITVDGGRSWSTAAQSTDRRNLSRRRPTISLPYRVYGTQQDQYDGLSLPSRTANFGARLQLQHWYTTGGMEGGFVALDPRDPDVIYADGPGGMMTRLDRKSMHLRSINVSPAEPAVSVRVDVADLHSPLDPENVYHTSQVVHRTERRRPDVDGHQPGSHAQRQEPADDRIDQLRAGVISDDFGVRGIEA